MLPTRDTIRVLFATGMIEEYPIKNIVERDFEQRKQMLILGDETKKRQMLVFLNPSCFVDLQTLYALSRKDVHFIN